MTPYRSRKRRSYNRDRTRRRYRRRYEEEEDDDSWILQEDLWDDFDY